MARVKKDKPSSTSDEILQRKKALRREQQRKRREKLKSNKEEWEKAKAKERERWRIRREHNKVKLIGDKPKVEQKIQREKWTESNHLYQFKKKKNVNTSLQQRIHSLNRRLEQLTVQNQDLQRENDEQKDLLSEAEQREKSSKLELQKILKEKRLLQKKIEFVQEHARKS